MNRKIHIIRPARVLALILLAVQLAFTGVMPVNAASLHAVTEEREQFRWDSYSNDYYYSRLSEEEQELYEKLDAVCKELLESGKDANSYTVKGVTRYGTSMVTTDGLSNTQIEKIQTAFLYNNPQYYFLNTIRYLSKNNSGSRCALGIYDAFASGSEREEANIQVEKQLKKLQNQVTESEYLYETEKSIHDVLCDSIRYGDETLISDSSDKKYYQTIYGALINGETVCAGYTKLYVALCNYFNIDCIAVNSKSHAWNMVRYGDNWYHVDVTWDESTKSEQFFHLTTRQLLAKDQNQSHEAHGFWGGLVPEADLEFDPSLQTLKRLKMPEVTEKDTASGTASITKAKNVKGKKIKVQYQCSEPCDGYEISYASKKDFSNQKSAKVKSNTVTIKKLKKKTYYVRVRAYRKDVNGNLYYTPYSKTKKVVVTK